jgi:ParB-like chromosome segregation protein Spo0J
MMSNDELDALAADIKANGLTSPISFFVASDGTLTLADGRNRLEALEPNWLDVDAMRHRADRSDLD